MSHRISLERAFGPITPKKRERPVSELLEVFELTPEHHKIHHEEEYDTIGDFIDKKGVVQRTVKRTRVNHSAPCCMCVPAERRYLSKSELKEGVFKNWETELPKDLVPGYENVTMTPELAEKLTGKVTKRMMADMWDWIEAQVSERVRERFSSLYKYLEEVEKDKFIDMTEKIEGKVWSSTNTEYYDVPLHCFAEHVLASLGYRGENLEQFLDTQEGVDVGLIAKCYNPKLDKEALSSCAAGVAGALFATRKKYTQDEWIVAEYLFLRKVKQNLRDAVSQNLGCEAEEDKNPKHWFRTQFHKGGGSKEEE
ncbi:hypothetical protein ABW21_db0202491 [Orbilia brochopaga]|nr:hypothetical protein ABW21_db0202491 [Drechslerella brochopaga]